MKHIHTVVALNVGPAGAQALCATTRDGNSFAVRRQSSVAWEDEGPELAPRAGKIEALLREAAQGADQPMTGALALDPSWVLCRTVAVPPASPAKVRAFLQLWVERQFPNRDYGTMRWGWRPTGESKTQALVLLARESSLLPIEDAMKAAGIVPTFSTAAPFAQASLLECAQPCLLISTFAEGTAAVGVEKDGPASLRWIPGAQGHALLGQLLQSLSGDLFFAGTGLDQLRTNHPEFARAQPIDWVRTIEKKQLVAGSPSLAPGEETLHALLPAAYGKRNGTPTLTHANVLSAGIAQRLAPLTEKRRATRTIALLAALLLVALIGGHFLRGHLYASSQGKAARLNFDEAAAQQNLSILAKLEAERRNPLDVLLALKEIKPPNVAVSGIQYDKKGSFTVTGTTNAYSAVDEFVVKLNESRTFSGTGPGSPKKEGDSVKFAVTGKLERVR